MPDPITLRDPSSPLTATYVRRAGMICTSLNDDGAELLGQRHGLAAYLSNANTMGIPLLYPWANRLGGMDYPVQGSTVTLTPETPGLHTDTHGAPIHGTLAAHPGWRVTAHEQSRLSAELNYAEHPELLAAFPFPHLLTMDVTLADRTLTVRTTVTGDGVPLCFGYHPYLQLPGTARCDWVIQTPAMRRLGLDPRGLPTGTASPWRATSEPLGDTTFDDGYDDVPPGAVFAVSGDGKRIEVRFDEGYPAAQIYAPADDDVICFEPMAAPTDALRRGGYRTAGTTSPGIAQFSIHIR